MVEAVYDLWQPSMFTTTFRAKPGLRFFFPLGSLSVCYLKHGSQQNPDRPQPKLFPHGEPWKTSVTAPDVVTS